MRKVIVNEFMSLDGVVQAPGGADEDTTGDFRHGGWHMQYLDDVSRQRVLAGIVEAGGFLLGRQRRAELALSRMESGAPPDGLGVSSKG